VQQQQQALIFPTRLSLDTCCLLLYIKPLNCQQLTSNMRFVILYIALTLCCWYCCVRVCCASLSRLLLFGKGWAATTPLVFFFRLNIRLFPGSVGWNSCPCSLAWLGYHLV
jgi:hypothetical protein